jgi:hypothetical protein
MRSILGSGALALIITVAVAGSASAGVITQTKTFGVDRPNFSQDLMFDQFDDQGGTLTLNSIEVIVNLNVAGGSLKVDNDSPETAIGNVFFGAELLLTLTVSMIDASSMNIIQVGDVKATGGQLISLLADDGDAEVIGGTPFFSYAGVDYGFYNGGSLSDGDSGFVNPTVFSQYIGTGQYKVTADTLQIADYSALGGVQAQIDPLFADGTVQIIYNFTPEPATLSMLLLGGLGLPRRRMA